MPCLAAPHITAPHRTAYLAEAATQIAATSQQQFVGMDQVAAFGPRPPQIDFALARGPLRPVLDADVDYTISEDPVDQAPIKGPRLGFYGVVDERMDLWAEVTGGSYDLLATRGGFNAVIAPDDENQPTGA